MRRFNEFTKCMATGEILMYGDFYYEDDTTGKIVSAKHYHARVKEKREASFDTSLLEKAATLREYEALLKAEEQKALSENLLNDYPKYNHYAFDPRAIADEKE